jgi:hypothetical protein
MPKEKKPAPLVRKITAISPIDGKQKHTTISLTRHTEAQADEIEKGWKAATRAGQPYKRPIFPRNIPEYHPEPERQAFEFKDLFETLELPTNGGCSFALIGSTRCGKSTALCAIYEQYFKKHITTLFTLSSHADIYKCLKKAIVCQGFFPKMITQPLKLNVETQNKFPFCLIFDDLALDGKNSEAMTRVLTTGRNSGASCIISGQKMSMLSATGRSNVNYVLCFKQNSEMAIEDTIKCFLRSYFPKHFSIPEMIACYKEKTQDHHFFVVDALNDKCFISKISM